jgi:uncharacterized RDD family membrane protein YckC
MAPTRRLEAIHVVRTPEYVEFEYLLAGTGSRFLAWLLDSIIGIALSVGAGVALTAFSFVAGGFGFALQFIVSFLINWGYFVFFECYTGGQTPGKKALRLRVLQDTGVRIAFYQSALRNLLRLADLLPLAYLVGGVLSAFTRDGKRLGDLAAGTIVVCEPRRRVLGDIARPQGDLIADRRLLDRVRRASVDERELFVSACLRREELAMSARLSLFPALAKYASGRYSLEKPPHLSDEKFVVLVTGAMVSEELGRVAKRQQRHPGPAPAAPNVSGAPPASP